MASAASIPATLGRSWWDVQGEWVEPPNERRSGISGVRKVSDASAGTAYYVKRQTNHLYRSLRFPMGRPTLHREWNNLLRCAALGVPSAPLVFFDMRRGSQGWEAVLVTRELEHYVSLEEGLATGRWNIAERRAILRKLAGVLASLHRAGRKHGHLYPKEIFVRTEPSLDVALLDWEVSRYVMSARWAAQSDLGRLWRSLMAMGIREGERHEFLAFYQSLTGLTDLRLRGVSDFKEALPSDAQTPSAR